VTEKNCMTQCVKVSISLYVNNSDQEHTPLASSIMYARRNTPSSKWRLTGGLCLATYCLSKRVNTSLWKTKMLITLLSEHLLISKLK
jgi:hypothetical protein